MTQPEPTGRGVARARADATPRAVVLEQVTIGYNVIEGLIAVTFGIIAGSIALTGFGFDSWIEVTAAAVVLRRLRAEIAGGERDEDSERRALRIVAVTFFVLAVYVTVEGIRDLLVGDEPSVSVVGILLTGLSAVIMPTLARLKRKAGEAMNSRLVLADASETKLCAWLSVSTLAGLLGFAAFGLLWIDPLAGFVIAYFAVREGREAWEGELVCDDENDDD
jgi:divalent metal cation (Fe/Co/Zn/Cd) transporter